jgi:hypothetical protein
MDPLADAAVQAIYQQQGPVPKGSGHHATGHQALAQVNALLAKLHRNDAEVPAELPQPVQALFLADAHVGTAAGGWDEARLRRGAHFFERHGLTIATLLHLMSLPQTYAAARRGQGAGVYQPRGAADAAPHPRDGGRWCFRS